MVRVWTVFMIIFDCPKVIEVSWLTGGSSVHVSIHVLSRDGQSISGSRDTLTGGGGGCSAHPCTVPGWSEHHGSARWDGVGCTSRCYLGKVRVFRELWPGMIQSISYLKNFYAIRWRHWTSLLETVDPYQFEPVVA